MTNSIHWHHTIPRSLGGTDSLQIPLCGDCHTNLHSHASGVAALVRNNGKVNNKTYWPNPADEHRAKHWLQVLVQALLLPPIAVGDKKTLLPMISVDASTRQQIELLKKDLPGITNLEQLLLFCINYTLKNRGYKNDKDPQLDKKGHGQGNHRNTNVW